MHDKNQLNEDIITTYIELWLVKKEVTKIQSFVRLLYLIFVDWTRKRKPRPLGWPYMYGC